MVSRTSGHVFERSLIERYIETEGSCPITNEKLGKEDLIAMKRARIAAPRSAASSSLPDMLALFQGEWDSLMLETFTLKKHLDATRKELSTALYQHDAATRVIARLVEERDEARRALLSSQQQMAQQAAAVAGGGGGGGGGAAAAPAAAGGAPDEIETLPAVVTTAFRELSEQLMRQRKKRKRDKAKTSVIAPERVGAFEEKSSHTPHASRSPGLTCMAIHPDASSSIVATGGVDKMVKIFDRGEFFQ